MDALPDELLLKIFENLSPSNIPLSSSWHHPNSRHLANVCSVDRRCNRIATPLLYEVVGRDQGVAVDSQGKSFHVFKGTRFNQLIRTLRSRPVLWSCIKRFSNHHFPNDSASPDETDVSPDHPYSTDAEYTALLDSMARELQIPDSFDVARRHCQGAKHGVDMLFTLAIFLAPNLEHLVVNVAGRQSPSVFGCLITEGIARSACQLPLGLSHSFEKLRVLELHSRGTFPTSYALPLLSLPKLDSLRLERWYVIRARTAWGNH
jgi:hypothetical protein